MPNTTRYNIPYPANTDYVTNGASAMGSLAGAVDDLLGSTQFMGGFRNKLINGDFTIWQRGAGAFTTSGAFAADRWQLAFNAGTQSVTREAVVATDSQGRRGTNGPQTGRFYLRTSFNGGSGAGDYSILTQKIENVGNLAGQTVTVSFFAKSDFGSPKIGVSFDQLFGTGGSPSAAVLNAGASVTIGSFNFARHSVTLTLPTILNKTLGTNNNDSLQLNLWLSAGSSLATRSGSVGVQAATIQLFGVQVEQGSNPTFFEERPEQVEIALCQRYYWRISSEGATGTIAKLLPLGYQGQTTSAIFPVIFPVRMRSAPTLGALAELSDDISYSTTIFTITAQQANGTMATAVVTNAAAGAQFRPAIVRARSNNTDFVDFSSEF
jgi:hypothetical protein